MTSTPRTLIVGSSLEPASDLVVATALDLARASGANVHLVHAFAMPAIYSGAAMTGGVLLPTTPREEDRCQAALDRQLERLGRDRSEIAEVVLEPGPPHLWLVDTAETTGADLIVVGAHEGSQLSAVLGSTADRVLRKAQCPVLVVRQALELPVTRVLAPVDLSPLSRACVERGLRHLEALQEAPLDRLDLLFVLSRVDRDGSADFTPEQVERFARLELERFAEALPKTAAEPELLLRVGLARQEIVEAAEEHPWDLMILGTHGRSGFERFMLGSIASGVVRRATGNVLVVPADAEDTAEDATLDDAKVGAVSLVATG